MKKVQDKNHVDEKTFLLYYLFCKQNALVAESVDASDLKSDWANNSVPVQVWPRANKKELLKRSLFLFNYCGLFGGLLLRKNFLISSLIETF